MLGVISAPVALAAAVGVLVLQGTH
jgi:hypothetical protein